MEDVGYDASGDTYFKHPDYFGCHTQNKPSEPKVKTEKVLLVMTIALFSMT